MGLPHALARPFLSYSDRRDLREKVWRTFVNRGDNGDAKDNNKIIAEVLALRAERAKVLGYATHAHWRLENSMAKTPERAMQLLEAVWTPAVARVREEVADMQAIADKDKAGLKIEPWDYRYYAEKVRKAKYDSDDKGCEAVHLGRTGEAQVEGEGVLGGGRDLRLPLHAVPGVPVPRGRPRVGGEGRVRENTWALVLRPYGAAGKQSGAWMNAYRTQEKFERP